MMLGHGIMYVLAAPRQAVHVLKGHVHVSLMHILAAINRRNYLHPRCTRSVRTVTPLYHPNGEGSDLWSYKFRSDPRCTGTHEGLQFTGLL